MESATLPSGRSIHIAGRDVLGTMQDIIYSMLMPLAKQGRTARTLSSFDSLYLLGKQGMVVGLLVWSGTLPG